MAPKRKAKAKAKAKKPRKKSGLMQMNYALSPELAEIVGARKATRPMVVKKLWVYIKKHGLQDNKNRRMINADENLKPIFGGKKQVSMFEMTKYVSKHLS